MTNIQNIKERLLQQCEELLNEDGDIYSEEILNLMTAYKTACEIEIAECDARERGKAMEQIRNYMVNGFRNYAETPTALTNEFQNVITFPDRFNNSPNDKL